MATPVLRLMPLDKTGVTEQQQQQQQHEKSPEKSPTNKIDDEMEFTQAIDQFTAAIELNRSNYTLYSNRSAAYIRLGRYAEALEDAKKTLELKPDWPKVKFPNNNKSTINICHHPNTDMLYVCALCMLYVCVHVHVHVFAYMCNMCCKK